MVDDKDMMILHELEHSADATTKKLAFKLGMPQTTVHNRIQRLKKTGVIKKYVAVLDYSKLGKPLTAYILVDIDYTKHYQILKKLSSLPMVDKIISITGANDVVIRVRVKDAIELGDIVLRKLRVMGGVSKTETLLELESFK